MPYAESAQPEHWVLLTIFFAIVALCSLTKKPQTGLQALPCISLGILALVVNSGLLIAANQAGYGSYDIVSLLTLRDAVVESTLIIIGYALMVRAGAMIVRGLFTQSTVASRTYL